MTDQALQTLTLTRTFDAPRELVFQAWTDPNLFKLWWGPSMFTNPVVELEPRPGGKFYVDMQGPDGQIYPDIGNYIEVDPPSRLVFVDGAFPDERGELQLQVRQTVVFDDQQGKTLITLVAEVLKAEGPAAQAIMGMEAGWLQSLDKLASLYSQGSFSVFPAFRMAVFTRVFDAPRELVYRVTTEPEFIPQWWGPRRLTTTVEQMDVRVGGKWRFVQRDAEGNVYPFYGEYLQIVPNERTASTFEFEPMAGHVLTEYMLLEDLPDGKTRMTVMDTAASDEDLDGLVNTGMEEGANESYERLAEVLTSLR